MSEENILISSRKAYTVESSSRQSDSDDDDFIGPPIPAQFLSTSSSEVVESSKPFIEEADQEVQESKSETSEYESDEDEDDNNTMFNRYENVPASQEVELVHGSKTVSALALDSNGSRVISGGVDYDVRLWDFDGMDSSLQAFRTVQPCGPHIIKNLDYSCNSELVLVVSGNSQAKVIDRNGYNKMECTRGDQYLRDMSNTKGHVGMLNDGCWSPREASEFITGSIDGTIRVWNISNELKQQKSVIKARNQGGLKAIPNSINYSRDGGLIIAACSDGSIQAWDHRRKSYVNNSFLIRGAHQSGTETSSVCFSYGGDQFASRGGDETLKLWDIRNTKTCIKSIGDLFNRYPNTSCSFSPDDKLVMTGISLQKGEETGMLKFFKKENFELHSEMKVASASVIRSMWHPKLNQIIVSTSNGIVKVFFDEKNSERGAKLCLAKTKRRNKDSYQVSEPQIIAPHSLPLFKQKRRKSQRVQMMEARKDPLRSRRPELPVTGPGQGGRIASAGSTYASFIARNIATKNRKIDDNEDPREALLKHAKKAEEEPYWVAPAYKTTQPKPIYQQQVEEEEDNEPSEKN